MSDDVFESADKVRNSVHVFHHGHFSDDIHLYFIAAREPFV